MYLVPSLDDATRSNEYPYVEHSITFIVLMPVHICVVHLRPPHINRWYERVLTQEINAPSNIAYRWPSSPRVSKTTNNILVEIDGLL